MQATQYLLGVPPDILEGEITSNHRCGGVHMIALILLCPDTKSILIGTNSKISIVTLFVYEKCRGGPASYISAMTLQKCKDHFSDNDTLMLCREQGQTDVPKKKEKKVQLIAPFFFRIAFVSRSAVAVTEIARESNSSRSEMNTNIPHSLLVPKFLSADNCGTDNWVCLSCLPSCVGHA